MKSANATVPKHTSMMQQHPRIKSEYPGLPVFTGQVISTNCFPTTPGARYGRPTSR